MNNRIRQLRELKKLTQVDFGEVLGMTKNEIYNLESGRTKIKEKDIKLIISTFKVSETWLREGKGEIFKKGYEDDKKIAEITTLFMKLTPSLQDYALQQIKDLEKLQTLFIKDIRKSLK
ncbi:TPA: helix-turn-helix domain-containing protein [Clostridioides difficile]|uniref:transcriptional regulator n=1 Tax=Clostridioides difficile TaxID=1496 RepID=UPI00097FFBB1|nr:helix-turn-helix transcriptional regulator [Clostridioides difficile]EGT4186800.1 helix-turn-helix domain-containing protein [Clostridioides difficile]MDL0335349.1 helix-turn-helix domain-containing protein [Clostridioides difficile]SJT09358.1 transcriptional regulator, y4mF family [Clostridioides difficile]HBG5347127.1 helix-turn-helix domain-containing protein [Clostridioides difficile]HEK4634524.1 helix-turn-helix domain-containing protein [Clostridioides difficile]